MKILFTIVLILCSRFVNAQCDTSTIYNLRMTLDMRMNTNKWNYYNRNGVLAWANVNGYDSTLIPQGGYAIRQTTNKVVDGYGNMKVVDENTCELKLVRWMDINKKDLDGFVKDYRFRQ